MWFNGSLAELIDATSAFAPIQLSMPKPNRHGATEIRTRPAHVQFILQSVGDVTNVSAGFGRMIKIAACFIARIAFVSY